MRKNSEVSFFLLTNAKKRNELFGKYRSFDIAKSYIGIVASKVIGVKRQTLAAFSILTP
jgi:hypothetical protein